MFLKFFLVTLGYLVMVYIGIKIIPLKLKYANVFFVLSLLFHVFATFSWSMTLIVTSVGFIILFFLIMLYMFGL